MEDGLERSDKTLVHLVATAKRRKSDVPESSNGSLFNSYGNLFPGGNKRPIDSLNLLWTGPIRSPSQSIRKTRPMSKREESVRAKKRVWEEMGFEFHVYAKPSRR